MDACIRVAEPLCYSPEAITALFVNWLIVVVQSLSHA